MDAAIACRNLHKRYPARPAPVDAVSGLDLEDPETRLNLSVALRVQSLLGM